MFNNLISRDEFAKRLDLARKDNNSNYFGTALYLVGMRDEIKPVDRNF